MMLVAQTRVAPRMQNYRILRPVRRFRGMGVCSAATPGDCAGPYSSPMANFDYQQQLQQSGDVNLTPAYNPPTGYTPGGGPTEPNCVINAGGLQWVDTACVAAQSARSIAFQDAVAQAQLAANLQGCLNSQTDPAVCRARYPGVTPSGNVGGTVAPPPPPPPTPPAYTPPSNPTPPTGYIPQPSTTTVNPALLNIVARPIGGGTAVSNTSTASGFSLSSIPVWGWVAAGAAALFVFGGKH